jgi:transmembrane sensor
MLHASLDAGSGAWADGMLVAAHMRLADFLAELGRYRRGQLNCDPKVADLLISGTYPVDDSERVLDLLAVSLPVRIKRFTRYWVTVEARV